MESYEKDVLDRAAEIVDSAALRETQNNLYDDYTYDSKFLSGLAASVLTSSAVMGLYETEGIAEVANTGARVMLGIIGVSGVVVALQSVRLARKTKKEILATGYHM